MVSSVFLNLRDIDVERELRLTKNSQGVRKGFLFPLEVETRQAHCALRFSNLFLNLFVCRNFAVKKTRSVRFFKFKIYQCGESEREELRLIKQD